MAWGLGLCARGETDETDERAARRERDASRNHAPYMTHPASPVNVIMMSLVQAYGLPGKNIPEK